MEDLLDPKVAKFFTYPSPLACIIAMRMTGCDKKRLGGLFIFVHSYRHFCMLRNYIKIALRHLARNKIYSFINIAGLSIGLACAMLILLYVKDEVSYDRFQKNVQDIYRITTQRINKNGLNSEKRSATGTLEGPRFAQHIPEIKYFVRVAAGTEDVKLGAEIKDQQLLYADSSFFDVFSFALINGNRHDCLQDPSSVVLSEDEAKKRFGTTDAIGKIIMMRHGNIFVPRKVTAVAKRCPQNSSIQFDMLLPIRVSKAEALNGENWFNAFLNTFVVLAPHADPRAVSSKMTAFFNRDSKAAVMSMGAKLGDEAEGLMSLYSLQPLSDMHLSAALPAQDGLSGASDTIYSWLLSGIALFVLLIACINFVNLTIARSVKRAKEIGIRKVVGADRKQLMIQFLGESFLVCLVAFSLALLIALLVLPVFNDLANKALSLSYLFDAKLVGGYLLLFLVTAVLAGFYPALVLSGYDPVQTLYGFFIPGGKNYFQRSLVVVQFALASMLIIATITIYKQFIFLTTEKLGYDDTNIIAIDKQFKTHDEGWLFKNELLKDPDIIGVALRNSGEENAMAKLNSDSVMQFEYETVDESFLPMLNIPLVHGRNFSSVFPADSSNAVLVNETFARQAKWKDPVGQTLNFWYDHKIYTVIGVVKDYHYSPLSEQIGPEVFTMKRTNTYGRAYVKIRPKSGGVALLSIQRVYRQLFPIYPFRYVFMNEENRKNYEAEAKWEQIIFFGAALTIFISCIGLFGLSVLSAEKRNREIGIRKVLGAPVNKIVLMLSKDFLILVCIALIIAIPAAWYGVNKWLDNYAYRISVSWSLFASAGISVILIALITVSFQAIRAATANPVNSLRMP
jgi:putative ABC transport system permease protein